MAAPGVYIYMDNNCSLFFDPQWRTPFPGPLFQQAHDLSVYYVDAECRTVAHLVTAQDMHTTTESSKENETPFSESPSPGLPASEGFNREQTLFLIDLMRQHLETEEDGLPKTLTELNSRLRSSRSNKKHFWKETAEKMSKQFSLSFHPEKVARKWNTLIDAYKKIKDNNSSTGKGSIRFQYFNEMDDLLAGQHDIVFPVVGTSQGLDVRRPEALRPPSTVTACSPSSTPPSCSTPTANSPANSTPLRPLKRRREQDEVLQVLRESEEAAQRRHEEAQSRHKELLAQLKSAQRGFEDIMIRLLDKL